MSIYGRLTDKRKDTAALKGCIEETIRELLSNNTNAEHPGMLLGDIQSGKTRAFTGVVALGFDKKYDITVILTKGTRALVKQTVSRLKNEFQEFEDEDTLKIYDVMEIPDDLNEYIIEKQKIIIVVKKEDDNIYRLKKLFFETYQSWQNKFTLIVDDEADFVSIGYKSKKNKEGEKEVDLSVIFKQISDFRKSLKKGSDYLQVTATPYSLYLQPENIEVNNTLFSPMRPRFTVVLPTHEKYIGSDYYFEESKKENSAAKYLFHSIQESELLTLSKTHGRILDNVLSSTNLHYFRTAIINYITAGCIRIIQSERDGIKNYKSSFIIHTEIGTLKHANQSNVASKLIEALKVEAKIKSTFLRESILNSYKDLELSLSLAGYYVPSVDDVFEKLCEYVKYITVRVVNSKNDVLNLLNLSTGELRLDSPLNIFIGGQILDRGITVQNLIGFFYGRNPKKMQQDTVMQHARIFGARNLEDMAVTRLYTTNRIYESLRRMHQSDKALRQAFEKGGAHTKVAFIQKAADGKIIPCSPSKLMISNTVTLKPGGTLPIYGFQTLTKTHIKKNVDKIHQLLSEFSKGDVTKPFQITISDAELLLDLVFQTYDQSSEMFGCTIEEFKSSIKYACSQASKQSLKDKLYCFSNVQFRHSSRYKENRRGLMFNDVCYDGKTDAKKAREVASDIPCLFLSYQEGRKEQDWKDAEFYWPVLFIQKNLITSIFTTDTDSSRKIEKENDDDITDDTGPMLKP